jgi:hypothetical protein
VALAWIGSAENVELCDEMRTGLRADAAASTSVGGFGGTARSPMGSNAPPTFPKSLESPGRVVRPEA